MTDNLPSTADLRERSLAAMQRIGVTLPEGSGITARSPITGEALFDLAATTPAEVELAVTEAEEAFRTTPWCGSHRSGHR
jgi:aldehyde dehydrogenase (NAD+)